MPRPIVRGNKNPRCPKCRGKVKFLDKGFVRRPSGTSGWVRYYRCMNPKCGNSFSADWERPYYMGR